MNEPTEAQIKKNIILANEQLNKWCKTEGINYYEGIKALGFLFKYAVLMLQDRGHQVELLAYEHKGYMATVYKECFSQHSSDGFDSYLEPASQVKNEDSVLALFWAIYSIIDKEDKK